MIEINVRGDRIGVELMDDGSPAIVGVDSKANIVARIVMDPGAWATFLENAPRLRGVGISVAGRAVVPYIPGGDNNEHG